MIKLLDGYNFLQGVDNMHSISTITFLVLSFFAGLGVYSIFMYVRLNAILNEYIKKLEEKEDRLPN